ncbi:collagen-like protein [Cryobacterium sp. PH31-AA6]|uniref:collagen-like triple helix repeat-containing protein n=1 Tax=Cryobacterium sp. PH31-AA6 TaxID=3046205 RepID=UPI0024B94C6A|nr:collagen-like protein [Cryobacterium sp. PH31-AA6]MDJ0323157.1 collagen-like protein [Cryobacterium sp. PH31-AA6]
MVFRNTRIWQAATALVVILAVTILTSGAIYLGTVNNDLRHDLTLAREDIRASTVNADSLYEQLIASGIKPAAEKPAEVVAGDIGPSGDQGPRGFTGDTGATGADGIKGVDGLPGAAGLAGISGTSGLNGENSTIPGPAGAAGADSAVPGPTGPTGAAGEPPWSWTYADPAGRDYTCARTTTFDPAAPTYECAAQTKGVTP